MTTPNGQDLSVKLSRHAKVRCKQRSIPPLILHWLLEYGAEERSAGASKRFFNHESRRRLAADYGLEVIGRLGDLLNLYLVEGDGSVITAGTRTKRIRRR